MFVLFYILFELVQFMQKIVYAICRTLKNLLHKIANRFYMPELREVSKYSIWITF